jgi:hypothetical protein
MNPMKTIISALGAAALASSGLFGQPAPPPPAFEVASVKPLAPGQDLTGSKPIVDNSTIGFQGISTFNLICMAYDIRNESQIEDGPWKNTWVFQDLFSVQAKLPKGATVKQVPEMLRTLLAGRFALATHREQKIIQGFALTVGGRNGDSNQLPGFGEWGNLVPGSCPHADRGEDGRCRRWRSRAGVMRWMSPVLPPAARNET